MRLRERDDNWNASGLRRRQFRQASPDSSEPTVRRRKGGRAKQCPRNKLQPHEAGKWEEDTGRGRRGLWVRHCVRCGRVLESVRSGHPPLNRLCSNASQIAQPYVQ
jgi:hypothetical protein